MYYFKLQCFDEDLKKGTTALRDLSKIFGLKLHQPETPWMDTFYIQLPDEPKTACHILNVIDAFAHFHNFSHKLESEKISIPFEKFLKSIS